MKKLLVLVLTLCLALSLFGCGNRALKDIMDNVNELYDTDYDETDLTIGSGESSASFSRLNIDWVSGHVTVEIGDSDVVSVSEPDGFSADHQMRWGVKDDCLSIYFCKNHLSVGTDFKDKDLVVTLPRSIALTDARIDTVSADIDVSAALELNALTVDTVSAETNLEGLVVSDLQYDTVSGDLSGSVEAKQLEVNSVSGSTKLTLSSAPDKIKGDTVSGNLTFTMPDCEPVEVRTDSTSGDVKSDFASTAGADRVFDFETVSGDIELYKA